MLNGLSLFTGIGGIDVALSGYVRPIAYCEIDTYCQAVLLSRMATGDLVHAPIWDDVKTLRIRPQEVDIDIIYGGFPCQDISVAGLGKGLAGERSGLFFEIMRLAKEIKPKFIFLENVPAITSRGGLQVVREITEMGYDCRWCVISAASVGALHRRERWFLLAHSLDNGASSGQNGGSIREMLTQGKQHEQEESFGEIERTSSISSDVANTSSESADGYTERKEKAFPLPGNSCANEYTYRKSSRKTRKETKPEQTEEETRGRFTGQYWPFESRKHWQKTVSEMGKCSNGVPNSLDRLRALGNAVVPQQVREAFEILMGLK